MTDEERAEKRRKNTEYSRQYRAANQEKMAAQARARRAADRDKHRKYHREYYRANKDRLSSNTRKYMYGLTSEQYDALLATQNHACAVCAAPADKALSVDHCHETKAVRGLLCQPCNMALGLFKDDTASLQRAIDYLSAAQPKDLR